MSLTSGMPLLPVPLTNRTRFCLSQTAPLGPRLPKIPFIFQDGSGPQSDQPSRVTTPPSEYHILWAGGRPQAPRKSPVLRRAEAPGPCGFGLAGRWRWCITRRVWSRPYRPARGKREAGRSGWPLAAITRNNPRPRVSWPSAGQAGGRGREEGVRREGRGGEREGRSKREGKGAGWERVTWFGMEVVAAAGRSRRGRSRTC